MTLALLLTAVTGAWAQTAFKVVEFKVPADWETDNNPVTAGDLPGFKAVTLDEAQAWTGAPKTGKAFLVYAFDGNTIKLVQFSNGAPSGGGSTAEWTKKQVFGIKSSFKFYYTTEITEWELTSKDGKNWILDKMPANNIELQVEYEPTKVTMAANDKTMGTVEVSGESKVEWTADTWKGWTSNTKEYTVGDITMTSTNSAYINEYTYEDKYLNSLSFYVNQEDNNSTVTFSTTGDPFSRIEFTMIDDYKEDYLTNNRWNGNPVIMPKDNWTFSGKSAVWEGEATKSLTLQSCTTYVSKITFFKGAVPDGVTVNIDGTFTVAKTATVTLTATPAEGYKFLYWEDDQTNTNPVREVTIESGMADMTYKAVFAEITYNVTFADGIEDADKWKAEPNAAAKNTEVKVTYSGAKKVLGMKAEKKAAGLTYPIALSAVTEEYIGSVVTTDGNVYATVAAATAASKTAVAMIAYVGSSTGDATYNHGLAIALSNEGNMNWLTAKSACEGKAAVTGAKWYLPSRDNWAKMIAANGGNQDNYSELNTKLETASGEGSKLPNGDYWTSTNGGDISEAYIVSLSNGSANFSRIDYKEESRAVRACLAF